MGLHALGHSLDRAGRKAHRRRRDGEGEVIPGEGSFGYSVALSATEGNYALIGAPGDDNDVGAAWVFTRSGSTWTQQGAKLTAKSGEEIGAGEFGRASRSPRPANTR